MTGLRAMPVLQVRDVRASEEFYQRLGFSSHGIWEHAGEAQFCIVQRDAITIALQRAEGPVPANTHWAAYLYVSDVTAFHAEFHDAGIEVTEIRRDNPYGCDDFDLRDPDGHLICFGQDMHPSHGPGLAATPEDT